MTIPLDVRESGDWVSQTGPDRDVALSSRVRMARNLSGIPFPERADETEKKRVLDLCRSALLETSTGGEWKTLQLETLEELEKKLLNERHLASLDLLEEPRAGLFFRSGETLGIQVNEEDHLRIQSLQPGRRLDEAFEATSRLERGLDQQLPFAFDPEWGYLTSCPTNLGTGLRASVLLHLPALVLRDRFNRVLKAISNLGLTVRGFYGEGTESQGFYFQLSNQITLGQTAEEMKNNLQRVSGQVVEQEREARQRLLDSRGLEMKDRLWRAFGILRHARSINGTEALQMLSFCRLGAAVGIFPEIELEKLDGLLMRIQPAHLQTSVGESLGSDQRDFYRARMIRRLLSESDDMLRREHQDGSNRGGSR